MIYLVAFFFLNSITHAAPPPYFIYETKSNRDTGAIDENDRALYDYGRRTDLTSGGTVDGALTISGSGNGITFPDGTTQTTAATASSLSYTSSATLLVPGNFTDTTLGVCHSGSTVSFSTGGCRVRVWFNGSIGAVGGTNKHVVGILVDGAFPAPLTTTMGISMGGNMLEDEFENYSFEFETAVLSAESHSFCLTRAVSTLTGGMCTTVTFRTACQFGAYEVCE